MAFRHPRHLVHLLRTPLWGSTTVQTYDVAAARHHAFATQAVTLRREGLRERTGCLRAPTGRESFRVDYDQASHALPHRDLSLGTQEQSQLRIASTICLLEAMPPSRIVNESYRIENEYVSS